SVRQDGTRQMIMRLAEMFERVVGRDAQVEFVAYDDSRAGTPGADVTVEVRSPYAVSYLAHAPGPVGLARAYVSGYLDVKGDMYTALSRMQTALGDLSWNDKATVLKAIAADPLLRAAALSRLAPPPQEVRTDRLAFLSGRRHSKRRDAKAIS